MKNLGTLNLFSAIRLTAVCGALPAFDVNCGWSGLFRIKYACSKEGCLKIPLEICALTCFAFCMGSSCHHHSKLSRVWYVQWEHVRIGKHYIWFCMLWLWSLLGSFSPHLLLKGSSSKASSQIGIWATGEDVSPSLSHLDGWPLQ